MTSSCLCLADTRCTEGCVRHRWTKDQPLSVPGGHMMEAVWYHVGAPLYQGPALVSTWRTCDGGCEGPRWHTAEPP